MDVSGVEKIVNITMQVGELPETDLLLSSSRGSCSKTLPTFLDDCVNCYAAIWVACRTD